MVQPTNQRSILKVNGIIRSKCLLLMISIIMVIIMFTACSKRASDICVIKLYFPFGKHCYASRPVSTLAGCVMFPGCTSVCMLLLNAVSQEPFFFQST